MRLFQNSTAIIERISTDASLVMITELTWSKYRTFVFVSANFCASCTRRALVLLLRYALHRQWNPSFEHKYFNANHSKTMSIWLTLVIEYPWRLHIAKKYHKQRSEWNLSEACRVTRACRPDFELRSKRAGKTRSSLSWHCRYSKTAKLAEQLNN